MLAPAWPLSTGPCSTSRTKEGKLLCGGLEPQPPARDRTLRPRAHRTDSRVTPFEIERISIPDGADDVRFSHHNDPETAALCGWSLPTLIYHGAYGGPEVDPAQQSR